MSLSEYFKSPLIKAAYKLYMHSKHDKHLGLLQRLHQSQYYPQQQLHDIQLKKLNNLLQYTYQHSQFWKLRLDQCGWHNDEITEFSEIQNLAVLTKTDIIKNSDQIATSLQPKVDFTSEKSGGTTGSPLTYYLDQHKIEVRQAATIRHNLWADYHIGDKLALVWGALGDVNSNVSLKSKLKNYFWGNQIILDSNDITEENLRNFISAWRKYQPDVLLGYANGLFYFAEYLENNNIDIPAPKSIISTAETLTSAARVKIETVLNCRVFERYGCREVSVIASECSQHNGLHINAENLLLEYLPAGENDSGEKLFKLLITDLENYAFPCIRYQLGDIVTLADISQACKCGRTLPRLNSVAGRVSDFIRLRNGRLISGSGLTISLLSKIKGILKTQIVQNSLEKLTLRIVKDDNFDDKSMEQLKFEFAALVGDNVRLDFDFPNQIEREKSGKYRLVISEMDY